MQSSENRLVLILLDAVWVVGPCIRRNLDGTDEVFLEGDTEACLGSPAEGCGFNVSDAAV